jgi:nucleotidyltransferase substrate binding protein (TIGR01987 family)
LTDRDSRWIQRFYHYSQALAQLTPFIQKGALNELEKQGLIQSFENTYALGWDMLRDYFESQGDVVLDGSRDVFRLAFRRGLIQESQVWMDMIKTRALTSRAHDLKLAEEIAAKIVNSYYPEFVALRSKMEILRQAAHWRFNFD